MKQLKLATTFSAIDCVWGTWDDWDMTFDGCNLLNDDCYEGERTRNRTKTTVAQYGGTECTGNYTEAKACDVVGDLEEALCQINSCGGLCQTNSCGGSSTSTSTPTTTPTPTPTTTP